MNIQTTIIEIERSSNFLNNALEASNKHEHIEIAKIKLLMDKMFKRENKFEYEDIF